MIGQLNTFLQETKQELKKVTWPTRSEVWQATAVVIVTTLLMAAFIGAIDFVLSLIIRIFVG